MDENHRRTFDDYRQKGLAARCGFGARPVLLIVDFINGFTDPSSPLGGPLGHEIEETGKLLKAFRRAGLPVIYTTIAYRPIGGRIGEMSAALPRIAGAYVELQMMAARKQQSVDAGDGVAHAAIPLCDHELSTQ